MAECSSPRRAAEGSRPLEGMHRGGCAFRYDISAPWCGRDLPRVSHAVYSVKGRGRKRLHWFGTNTDVDELKRVETALRDSEGRVRIANEATGVEIWEWNLKTNQDRWDAQMFRIYGMHPTPDGLVSYEAWLACVVEADRGEQHRALEETVARRDRSEREFRIVRHPDGEQRDIRAVETVRVGANGTTEWVIGTNLDVTDLKRATEALRLAKQQADEANRAKDAFLSALSHELRTRFRRVLLTASALIEEGIADPPLREDLEMIRRNVELEARLIDDLLDVTRIANGKLVLKEDRCDLHRVVRHAVDVCSEALSKKDIAVTFHFHASNPAVIGDAARLQQVFWNLINNATKFSSVGGEIVIASEMARDDLVRVTVRDRGIGIHPDHLPVMFDAFEQGGAKTTRQIRRAGTRPRHLQGHHCTPRRENLGRE